MLRWNKGTQCLYGLANIKEMSDINYTELCYNTALCNLNLSEGRPIT